MFIADIILFILFLVGGFLGARKELFQNILKLIRNTLTFFISLNYYQVISSTVFHGKILSKETTYLITFVSQCFFLYLLGSLVIFIIKQIVEVKFISLLEKILGFLIGTIQFSIITIWLITLFLLFPLPIVSETLLSESIIAQKMCRISLIVNDKIAEKLEMDSRFDIDEVTLPWNKDQIKE